MESGGGAATAHFVEDKCDVCGHEKAPAEDDTPDGDEGEDDDFDEDDLITDFSTSADAVEIDLEIEE